MSQRVAPLLADAEYDESFYPSAKVRLIVRFDELARRVFSTPDNPVPPRPTKVLSGIKDKRAPLKVVQDANAPTGVSRYILQDANRPLPGVGPEKQVKSKDGLTHEIEGIIPRSASWSQNGIRTADTLSLTLRYLDCPIDPRTVRSCAVEYYLGTVSPDDFAKGLRGEMRQLNKDGQTRASEPLNVVPDAYTDGNGVVRSNRRFIGWVDKWAVDMANEDEPLIRLDCRDNTQLLIDQEAPAKLVIAGSRLTTPIQIYGENGQVTGSIGGGNGVPIDYAIAQYLSHFPQFQGLKVEYRPYGETPPGLVDALSKTAFRPNLGPPPSLALGANTGLSVWDYMTDVCGALGLLCRVDDTTVIIQRGRSIYSDESRPVKRADDPFEPRFDGQKFRRFLYGRNIEDLKIERSFVRSAPTNIEVRCYSPRRKNTIVGRFPTRITGKGIQSSVPGDGGAEEKWLVWRVSGIENEKTLRVIAQTIYEMLGRAELSVKIKTHSLCSLGGGNGDPDILDMKAGDTFEVRSTYYDDKEGGTEPSKIDTFLQSQSQGEAFMKSLGFHGDLAQAYTKTFTDLGFQNIYKSRAISIGWEEGEVSIDLEGINYIEVRADPIKAGILAEDERQ
jgi:hypothetical protein